MNLGKFYFFIIFFLIVFKIEAQTLNFKHISYKEGLVQSPISSFLQDDKGFVWFGNLKGLIRYDGYEFKTFSYDENNPKSLSNNRVNVICQDHLNNLWIGTANGVSLYNRDTETFTSIDINLEIKGGRNYISSLIEDNNGNIWVGTFAGIRKLNRKTQKLEEVFTTSATEALGQKAIFSLFLDQDHTIWAGTKLGLKRFNPQTNQVLAIPSIFNEVKDLKVLVTKQDKKGNLWFGTETSGVYTYQKKENKLIRYLSEEKNLNSLTSNWIKDILLYDANHIWFATRSGISVLNLNTQNFSNYKHDPLNPNSLSDNAIWSFMKDKAGCVWVGTFTGGINFYYKGNTNFKNIGETIGGSMGLNHILVNALSEDKDGSWWVGTFGGGLNHLNIKNNTSEYFSVKSDNQERPSNGIKSLADDGNGNLWIGSLNGLSLFNKKLKTFKYFKFPVKDGKLSENLISSVLPDGQGAWIGTNGGGLRYVLPDGSSPVYLRKDNQVNTNSSNNLSDNFVTALIKDTIGNIWLGTQNGLNYYDKKVGAITKVYRKIRDTKYQIHNSNVTSLFLDAKKRLWIGTEGGWLNYYEKKTERFFVIDKSFGLGDDVIHSIVEDDFHNLWLSTDLGLYKVKFKLFSIPFKKQDIEVTAYTSNDGLISNQFSTNAAIKLRSGELLFGGINGLSLFLPNKIVKNTLSPEVALTHVLVNNKEVKIGGDDAILKHTIVDAREITVPYDQNNLTFTYSALNFINAENNQYAYQLQGLSGNADWQETGSQRVVNFANLSPGSYTFKVKAANNDNIWGNYIRTLKIIVLPPWWLTWWAYLIYLIFISIALTIIIRFLRNRADLKRDLYLEHVHNLRQEELYQMKLNFFTNISHEIRTPLTLILGPLDKILRSNESNLFAKQLDLIKNNAERLMKLVTELLDFRKSEEGHLKIHCSNQDIITFCKEIFDSFKELALDHDIEYEFKAPQQPVFIYFDENQLEKVIFNLLNNAFKFTPESGRIGLSISESKLGGGWIDIKIIDNGKGIPNDMQSKLFESFFQVDDRGRHNIGSGIGLALSKSIVELHKGKISLESDTEINSETTFSISLQKGNNHLDAISIIERVDVIVDNVNETTPTETALTKIVEDNVSSKGKKYTILVTEDNEEVRKLVVDILVDRYKIVQFSNAEDALDFMNSEIPDLIVSDIMMPGISGLDFCKQVKLQETSSHIPFILLTAKASIDNQIYGLTIGADAYISKPFSPQILELNIKNLLHAQEVMREKFGQQFVLNPSSTNIVSPEEKFLNKLMGIIEERMEDSEFDVTDLVNEIGMSRTVLYKKVQALTNYSVADLIKQIRLKKAAELFKTSTFSIAEVAYMVGFNDRKHFSKEFKKHYEFAPSEYIQNFLKKD